MKNLLTIIQRSFGSVLLGYAQVLLPHALYPFIFMAVHTPKLLITLPSFWSIITSVPSARHVPVILKLLFDGLKFGTSPLSASVYAINAPITADICSLLLPLLTIGQQAIACSLDAPRFSLAVFTAVYAVAFTSSDVLAEISRMHSAVYTPFIPVQAACNFAATSAL